MKISLITVTYNSSNTLKETIESVLAQSFTNIEYIIVDGASKDSTIDIVKQYEPLFKGRLRWVSEKDEGLYDAMNKGIQMANGDVVGILNSDDLFMDNFVLSDLVKQFTSEVDAVFGNLVFVESSNTDSIVRYWKGSTYRPFQSGWHPAHPTFYVRRNVYEKYGGFDTSFQVSADFELMLRFIEKKRIRTKFMDRYMIRMRMGGESTGSIKNIIRGNINVMRAFKKNELPVSPFYPIRRLFPKVVDRLKYIFKMQAKAEFMEK